MAGKRPTSSIARHCKIAKFTQIGIFGLNIGMPSGNLANPGISMYVHLYNICKKF
jgi:hypothetical protein